MSTIHFLNVKEGDCNIIQHDSGRVSVIDVSNGNDDNDVLFESVGNYKQKENPVNPIVYMKKLGIKEVFRFILTHPDMDHMDGLKKLFTNFNVVNFWDTNNNKEVNFDKKSRYKEDDWNYYQNIRKSIKSPKVLTFYSGEEGEYYNQDKSGGHGDGIHILAPNKTLEEIANSTKEYNNISYVLMYEEHGRKILFAGDSEEATWDFILANYEDKVKNIDILIAPHHGRKSGGNDDYLDILNPKITLLGNARSKYLDYSSYNNRNLIHYTNNEAGNIIININKYGIKGYCTCKSFAYKMNNNTYKSDKFDAWFLFEIY